MAKLTTSKRASLPKKDFAGPGRSFPVNDKNHARAALMDINSAPASARPRIKAKADAMLKKGGGGSMAARDKADKAADKKAGIKQGSKADIARDKKAGVYKFEYGSKKPGGGGSKSPTGGKRAPSAPKSGSVRYGGGGMRRGY